MAYAALDRDRLAGALAAPWRIEVVDQTRSTNADVADAARLGAPEGLVVTTEHQVAGRGRLGRTWVTPPRSGLAVSVLVRPTDVPPGRWPWLPLLTGIAVHACLTQHAAVPAQLKWPNDVLIDERKVAGILVERIETSQGAAAILGIGINTHLEPAELPTPAATALSLVGSHVDRTALLVDLLTRLRLLYGSWRRADGDAATGLSEAYERACATLGQRVRATLPDGTTVNGRATGIDVTGRLLVDTGEHTHPLGAGDVVHVRSGS